MLTPELRFADFEQSFDVSHATVVIPIPIQAPPTGQTDSLAHADHAQLGSNCRLSYSTFLTGSLHATDSPMQRHMMYTTYLVMRPMDKHIRPLAVSCIL